MIPKKIHFCWFSNDEYPEKISKCIDSWRKNLPDYEIIKWDFNKINKEDFPWISQAYDAKKYAFAADYVRVYALYHFGGIYLDSDVEVLKSFDDLLNLPYFIGKEDSNPGIEAATMGAEKGHPLFKDLIDYYNSRNFVNSDGTYNTRTIPTIMRSIIDKDYKYVTINTPSEITRNILDICVLPADFFSPKSLKNSKIKTTKNTYSIHHFTGSWLPWYYRLEKTFCHSIGMKNYFIATKIANLLKKYLL